jgi:hypothetical protein
MTDSTVLRVRVSVPDVWDIMRFDADADWTVGQLKSQALARATGRQLPVSEYIVKFRGARIFDESQRLSDLDVPDGASLIVLPARRQPVR